MVACLSKPLRMARRGGILCALCEGVASHHCLARLPKIWVYPSGFAQKGPSDDSLLCSGTRGSLGRGDARLARPLKSESGAMLACDACNAYNRCMQYTIRNV